MLRDVMTACAEGGISVTHSHPPQPQLDYFLHSSGEQECHDSALGPIHSLSCDDVTDGIFTLISHNKRKSRA